jgi:outer membrane protein
MKKIILLLVVTCAFSAASFGQKLGHINSLELLSKMPEVTVADKQVEDFGKTLQDQLQGMVTEYKTKLEDYQAKANLMNDAIRKVKEQELGQLEQRIQEFQNNAQENISTKKKELYDPILKKADEAIKAVAKENGYNYVFDTSVGALLFVNESDNVLSLVSTKLGLK